MAVAGTINARLPEDLKQHGSQVLDREGISITQAIRSLFEYLEKEQEVPEWMLSQNDKAQQIEKRRKQLRSLVGVVKLPKDFDAKQAYREHLLEKHAPGVRL